MRWLSTSVRPLSVVRPMVISRYIHSYCGTLLCCRVQLLLLTLVEEGLPLPSRENAVLSRLFITVAIFLLNSRLFLSAFAASQREYIFFGNKVSRTMVSSFYSAKFYVFLTKCVDEKRFFTACDVWWIIVGAPSCNFYGRVGAGPQRSYLALLKCGINANVPLSSI